MVQLPRDAAELGRQAGVAPTPLTPGMFGYSLLRANENREFFEALFADMAAFGVPIEGLHTETGPGVYEAAILFSEALEQADRAILFKTGAKEIGARFGIMPSFMAKWSQDYPGCSGHIHTSLSDGEQEPVPRSRAPARDEPAVRELPRRPARAALLEFAPMFWPTINSYKRLVDGFWAPVKPTWGVDNRTASFRVIPGSPKSTRLETRCPGADINPYLAMAAVIAAGLAGVEKKMKLDDGADPRHQPGCGGRAARAAHADRDHADLPQLGARPRLVRRRLRRPLCGDAGVGVAAVARRRHGLGAQALLRDHLGRKPRGPADRASRGTGLQRGRISISAGGAGHGNTSFGTLDTRTGTAFQRIAGRPDRCSK